MQIQSSPLNAVPSLLEEIFVAIIPGFLFVVESSLVPGCVPDYFQQAIIHPEKLNLDPLHPKNYRPISWRLALV